MIENINDDKDKDDFIKYYKENISTSINDTMLVELLIKLHKNDDKFMVRLYDELDADISTYWYRVPSDIDSDYDPDEYEAKPYLKNIPSLLELLKRDINMINDRIIRMSNDVNICCEYFLSKTLDDMNFSFNTLRFSNAGDIDKCLSSFDRTTRRRKTYYARPDKHEVLWMEKIKTKGPYDIEFVFKHRESKDCLFLVAKHKGNKIRVYNKDDVTEYDIMRS
jgi:hypothetical protein